jgi:hypothetical protein
VAQRRGQVLSGPIECALHTSESQPTSVVRTECGLPTVLGLSAGLLPVCYHYCLQTVQELWQCEIPGKQVPRISSLARAQDCWNLTFAQAGMWPAF